MLTVAALGPKLPVDGQVISVGVNAPGLERRRSVMVQTPSSSLLPPFKA
jgi:hypothetical protein